MNVIVRHCLSDGKLTIVLSSSQVQFSISQLVMSGLKVSRLDMYGEVRT